MQIRALLAIGVVVVAAVLGYQYWEGDEEPTGRPLAEVMVPALTAGQREGEVAFKENCVACHGLNASGREGFGPPLVHKIYEPSHHGDMAFVLAAKQGVRQHHWPFGHMPPQPHVRDKEIAAIIDYVRALQRANGIN